MSTTTGDRFYKEPVISGLTYGPWHSPVLVEIDVEHIFRQTTVCCRQRVSYGCYDVDVTGPQSVNAGRWVFGPPKASVRTREGKVLRDDLLERTLQRKQVTYYTYLYIIKVANHILMEPYSFFNIIHFPDINLVFVHIYLLFVLYNEAVFFN